MSISHVAERDLRDPSTFHWSTTGTQSSSHKYLTPTSIHDCDCLNAYGKMMQREIQCEASDVAQIEVSKMNDAVIINYCDPNLKADLGFNLDLDQ